MGALVLGAAVPLAGGTVGGAVAGDRVGAGAAGVGVEGAGAAVGSEVASVSMTVTSPPQDATKTTVSKTVVNRNKLRLRALTCITNLLTPHNTSRIHGIQESFSDRRTGQQRESSRSSLQTPFLIQKGY